MNFSKTFKLSLIVILFAFVSCDNDSDSNTTTPVQYTNTITYNGTSYSIDHIGIYYSDDERDLQITAQNIIIHLRFAGLGDPTVTANEFPKGTWTAFSDTAFVSVRIFYSSASNVYDSTSTADPLTITIGGTESETITINTDFVFTSGGNESLALDYSGEYSYSEQ